MMRKLFYTLVPALLMAGTINAQLWLEAGGKFTFGPSGYYNAALAGDENHDYSLNMAFSAGLVAGLNIGDYHGINLEALFGTYFQDLTYRGGAAPEVNSLEWEVADLYALYRFYPENGMYLELGPKLSQVRKTGQSLGIVPADTKDQYANQYYSAVAGVGALIAGSDLIAFKMGLRAEYGLTDLASETGQTNGFPAYYAPSLVQGEITRPFRVTLGLELSFGIGGVAKASCGRRAFMLGSKYK
jgi:hypothetical protein